MIDEAIILKLSVKATSSLYLDKELPNIAQTYRLQLLSFLSFFFFGGGWSMRFELKDYAYYAGVLPLESHPQPKFLNTVRTELHSPLWTRWESSSLSL
jgi:hypothetical protein